MIMKSLNPFTISKVDNRFFDNKYFIYEFNTTAIDNNVFTETETGTGAVTMQNDAERRVLELENTGASGLSCFNVIDKRYGKGDGAITIEFDFTRADTYNRYGFIGLGTTATDFEASAGADFVGIRSYNGTTLNLATCKNTTATNGANETVVAGTYYNVKIKINSDWTSVSLLINDVVETTITTNIPDDIMLWLGGSIETTTADTTTIRFKNLKVYNT